MSDQQHVLPLGCYLRLIAQDVITIVVNQNFRCAENQNKNNEASQPIPVGGHEYKVPIDDPHCLSHKRKRMAELRDRTPEMQLTATPGRRLQLCFNCILVIYTKRAVCSVLAYSFVFFTGRG
jgi:hypothetical protein